MGLLFSTHNHFQLSSLTLAHSPLIISHLTYFHSAIVTMNVKMSLPFSTHNHFHLSLLILAHSVPIISHLMYFHFAIVSMNVKKGSTFSTHNHFQLWTQFSSFCLSGDDANCYQIMSPVFGQQPKRVDDLKNSWLNLLCPRLHLFIFQYLRTSLPHQGPIQFSYSLSGQKSALLRPIRPQINPLRLRICPLITKHLQFPASIWSSQASFLPF